MSRRWARRAWIWAAVGAAAVGAIVGGIFAARGSSGPAVPSAVSSSGGVVELAGRSPITGQTVDLGQYRGRPIVLNLWASWCTGCREEARDLALLQQRHPEAQVIGLDTQDRDGDARAFYREFGWSHPSIRDPSGELAARLGLQGLPTTIFLDRNHRIVTRIVGATDLDGFERGLQAAAQRST